METAPFTIERIYNVPVEKVWKAITDKHEMKQWYFDLAEFKPEVGFEFQFYGEGKAGEKFLHICTITDVIKNKKHTFAYFLFQSTGNFWPRISTNESVGSEASSLIKCLKRALKLGSCTTSFHSQL